MPQAQLGYDLLAGHPSCPEKHQPEWWVSQDWGIGVAAQIVGAGIRHQDSDEPHRVSAFSIALSATYN